MVASLNQRRDFSIPSVYKSSPRSKGKKPGTAGGLAIFHNAKNNAKVSRRWFRSNHRWSFSLPWFVYLIAVRLSCCSRIFASGSCISFDHVYVFYCHPYVSYCQLNFLYFHSYVLAEFEINHVGAGIYIMSLKYS